MNKFALACIFIFGVSFVVQQEIADESEGSGTEVVLEGCGCGKTKGTGGGN